MDLRHQRHDKLRDCVHGESAPDFFQVNIEEGVLCARSECTSCRLRQLADTLDCDVLAGEALSRAGVWSTGVHARDVAGKRWCAEESAHVCRG